MLLLLPKSPVNGTCCHVVFQRNIVFSDPVEIGWLIVAYIVKNLKIGTSVVKYHNCSEKEQFGLTMR